MNKNINYKINPVKATCLKYGKDYRGIQGLNDTCFGICAAFSGTYDTYAMDPKCSKSCEELVEQRKHELFGVGSCDHQVPYRPVFWDQVPRYVPMLLRKGKTPEMAKKLCFDYCLKSSLKQECFDKCNLDFNAIEQYETQNDENKYELEKKEKSMANLKEEEKSHSSIFWVIMILIIFLFLVAVVVILSKSL